MYKNIKFVNNYYYFNVRIVCLIFTPLKEIKTTGTLYYAKISSKVAILSNFPKVKGSSIIV